MSFPATLTASPHAERRNHNARHKLHLLSAVSAGQNGSHDAQVLDISATGLLLQTVTSLAIGERLHINLDAGGTCDATIIWASGKLYGCRFDTPLSAGQLAAAILRGESVSAALPANDDPAGPDQLQLPQHGAAVLASLRRSRGLTQQELANLVGVSKTTIWKWENDAAKPRRMMAARLEQLLGTNAFGPDPVAPRQKAEPANQGGANLESVIRSSKERIAAAAGISPGRITVQIRI